MKKILITLFSLITLALLALPVSATVISSTYASASSAFASDYNSSGYVSSSNAIYDPANFAKAKTSGSSIGVEARSSNGQTSRATASWSDVWGPTTAYVTAPFMPVLGFNYHLDGVIDPLFLNHTSAADVYMDISFSYDFGYDQHFHFGACYDGGPCGLGASLNGVDLTSHIIYGTNAAGETTFALNYYSPPAPMFPFIAVSCPASSPPYACIWDPDSMSASATIEPFSTTAPGDYHLNFINTFSVGIVAGNPESMLVSEGGRLTTLAGGAGGGQPIPEPSTLLLMSAGLAAMLRLARSKTQIYRSVL